MDPNGGLLTALERRERRPTGTIVFMAALFALPIGTCGGIGATKAAASRKTPVATTVAALRGGPDAIGEGTYVSLDARLREIASGELPVGEHLVVEARGTTVYGIEGAPGVYVATGLHELPSERDVRVEGRICSPDSHLVCEVGDTAVRDFLRAEERRTNRAVRAITLGEKPSANIVEACIGLGIAGLLLLVLLAVVALVLRGRRGPRMSVERLVAVRDANDLARVRGLLGPRFRVAHAAPRSLVLLTGQPASRAQLVGAFASDDYPQRVEIELAGAGYREASARVRVTEIFAQPAGPPPQMAASVRAALEATLQRVASALQAA